MIEIVFAFFAISSAGAIRAGQTNLMDCAQQGSDPFEQIKIRKKRIEYYNKAIDDLERRILQNDGPQKGQNPCNQMACMEIANKKCNTAAFDKTPAGDPKYPACIDNPCNVDTSSTQDICVRVFESNCYTFRLTSNEFHVESCWKVRNMINIRDIEMRIRQTESEIELCQKSIKDDKSVDSEKTKPAKPGKPLPINKEDKKAPGRS